MRPLFIEFVEYFFLIDISLLYAKSLCNCLFVLLLDVRNLTVQSAEIQRTSIWWKVWENFQFSWEGTNFIVLWLVFFFFNYLILNDL